VNLLGAKLYDPAVAVTKNTTAALAMTALDTTNLRIAVTVPAHGIVKFRLSGCVHGATTFPSILLGVLNGSTVVGRMAPIQTLGNTAVATALLNVEAQFIVTGLTPGAANFDAAYAVETIVAATGIKYGGPNDTTVNNAFGAFVIEAWDPQSQTANTTLSVDANGRVDIIKVAGTTQTARDLGAQLDAAVTTRMASYTQPTGFLTATFPAGTVANTTNITAGTITTVTNLTNAPTAGDLTATMKTSVTTAATAATPVAASVTGAVGSVTGAVGSVTAAVTLPTIPNNWISAAGIAAAALNGKGDWNIGKTGYSLTQTFPSNFSSLSITAGGLVDVTQAAADKAWGTTTRALTGTQTFNNTGTWTGNLSGSVGSVTGLTASNLDATVSSRLATAGYTAPGNSDITAIKAKTDSLTFTVANKLDGNITAVNGVTVNGSGTAGSPWGP
jgi:hypothetical protein